MHGKIEQENTMWKWNNLVVDENDNDDGNDSKDTVPSLLLLTVFFMNCENQLHSSHYCRTYYLCVFSVNRC